MIEAIDPSRCTSCNVCVLICPTDVFEMEPGQLPVLARQSECQTCFQCEAYCPADAIFVDTDRDRIPEPADGERVEFLRSHDLFGRYRSQVGWAKPSRTRATGA